ARRADGGRVTAGGFGHECVGGGAAAGRAAVAGAGRDECRWFAAFDPPSFAGGQVLGAALCAGRPVAGSGNERVNGRPGLRPVGNQAGPRPVAGRATGASGGQPRRHDHRGGCDHGQAALPVGGGDERQQADRCDHRIPTAGACTAGQL
ncbi:MAG: FIG00822000: hypothetical protein, partial [uncultured Propionibacteriaceae bacterium]